MKNHGDLAKAQSQKAAKVPGARPWQRPSETPRKSRCHYLTTRGPVNPAKFKSQELGIPWIAMARKQTRFMMVYDLSKVHPRDPVAVQLADAQWQFQFGIGIESSNGPVKSVTKLVQWCRSLLSKRHDWCILWAYSLVFFLDFFPFVSPLETKGNQRKTEENRGNQGKPKEIKGYQRKNEII